MLTVNVDLPEDLPEEALKALSDPCLTSRVREVVVMVLLRQRHISQGNAAELLRIHRHALFDLMTKYEVPVVDLTEEELEEELNPFGKKQ
jgi:predicted HTH domain antitoxin